MHDIEQIYREHGSSVLAYLRHKIGAEAEDLLQETFVQVLRRSEALTEVRSVRAWLLTIARNLDKPGQEQMIAEHAAMYRQEHPGEILKSLSLEVVL